MQGGGGDKKGKPASPRVVAVPTATPDAGNAVPGTGAGTATGAVDSVRNHHQVVMKHVLDHELRMDLIGTVQGKNIFFLNLARRKCRIRSQEISSLSTWGHTVELCCLLEGS